MVSEGVDIPRLRVGVYATTTTTDLFFRQAVGRLVRWVTGVPDQRAWLFIPDDQRLRAWAALMAEQRRHSLVRERAQGEARIFESVADDAATEQLSMFAALSAVATETAPVISPWQAEAFPMEVLDSDPRIEVPLAELPSLLVPGDASDGSDAPRNERRAAAGERGRPRAIWPGGRVCRTRTSTPS